MSPRVARASTDNVRRLRRLASPVLHDLGIQIICCLNDAVFRDEREGMSMNAIAIQEFTVEHDGNSVFGKIAS